MGTKEQIANTAITATGFQAFLYFFEVYSSGIIALTTVISAIVGIVFYYFKHREQKRHNREIEKFREFDI